MNNKKRRGVFWWLFAISIGMSGFSLGSSLFPDSKLFGGLALVFGPFLMLGAPMLVVVTLAWIGVRSFQRVKKEGITDSLSSTSRILARVAAGVFLLSFFLPAVNMVPWLPGINLFGASFLGTFIFGLGLVTHGATSADGVPVLANFVTCLVGASANVLMLTTIFRISRGRRVPVVFTVLTLILTLAAAVGICYLHDSITDEFSFGYFAWVACAALLIAASLSQRTRADLR